MRRAGILCAVCALVVAAAASSAPGPRTLALRAPVRALSADGYGAAMLLGPPTTCHVVAWDARTGRASTLRRRCVGSNRDGTLAVARAGARVAWVETAGGNLLEELLYVASAAHRKPVNVAFLGSGPDVDGDYVGEVKAAGPYVFFTQLHRCVPAEPDAPPNGCPSRGAVDQGRLWLYDPTAPGDQCPTVRRLLRCRVLRTYNARLELLWASPTRVLVRFWGATTSLVYLVATDGRNVNRYSVGSLPATAALDRRRLLFQMPSSFEVYDATTGSHLRSFAAPGRLFGAAGGAAYFLRGRTISRLRLTDGHVTGLVVPGRGAVRAAVSARGLFYSFTAAGKGRVRFRPHLRVVVRAA